MKIRADTHTYDIFEEQWAWLFQPESFEEESPVWTESDILQLFELILQDSLTKLKDPRLSHQKKVEIYQWVADESDPNPFSFNNCCRCCGLDADLLREAVLYQIRRLRNALH